MPRTEDDVAPQPRRGRPRDPERLRRIVEAAHSHFNAHRLERASVDAIAADAGVSKTTIYSHFASKERLFEALVHDRADRVMSGVAGVETLDPTRPQKALLAVGAQFLTLAREKDTLGQFRSIYGAAEVQREACRAFYKQGSRQADRRPGGLSASRRCAGHAGHTAPASGGGPVPVNIPWRWPHPRADDARYARRAGRQALLREAVRVFMAAYARAP